MRSFTIAQDSSDEKFSAVMEFDGSTYYLYLLRTDAEPMDIVAAVQVAVTAGSMTQKDFEIVWSADSKSVSLLVKGKIAAQIVAEGANWQNRILTI